MLWDFLAGWLGWAELVTLEEAIVLSDSDNRRASSRACSLYCRRILFVTAVIADSSSNLHQETWMPWRSG